MTKPLQFPAAVVVALFMVTSGCLWNDTDDDGFEPTETRPADYMVFVDAPQSEEELALITALSTFAAPQGEPFHPFFILEEGQLDDHALWTIDHLEQNDVPKYLFARNEGTAAAVEAQVGAVTYVPLEREAVNLFLRSFMGYNGTISVGGFEEALWASSLAHATNKVMIVDQPTFTNQSEVWEALAAVGVSADYVLAVNPDDRKAMGGVNAANGEAVSYHIPWLATVGGYIAAFRQAYVVTWVPEPTDALRSEWDYVLPPDSDNTPDFDDSKLNDYSLGLLRQLRELHATYGPLTNIALLGSAEAVPQWELVDHSQSEPDYVSSDVLYGFIDDDHGTMDVPVGRFVNYNVQGMANQVTRTFCYERIVPEVTVDYGDGPETYEWRTTGSDLNGFEVADMRLQNTPGLWAVRDYEDEDFTAIHYVSTAGVGVSGSDDWANIPTDAKLQAYLESAGHVLYRGHGSWHGGFYTWRYYGPGLYDQGAVEGTDARTFFLPPQATNIFSCENTKIHGLSYGGDPIEMDRDFATNWMYAGSVGLIGATEVSYSNIGQDFYSVAGEITGEHNWDLNNLWFAGAADNTLDHEMSMGMVVLTTENRYLAKHAGEGISVVSGDGAHWKEVTMYCLLGDPAFEFYTTSPGPNDYDPWH